MSPDHQFEFLENAPPSDNAPLATAWSHPIGHESRGANGPGASGEKRGANGVGKISIVRFRARIPDACTRGKHCGSVRASYVPVRADPRCNLTDSS